MDFYSIVVSITSFLTITQILISILIIWLSYKTYQFWTLKEHINDPDHRVFKNDQSVSGSETYPNTWYPIIRSKDILPGEVRPQYVLDTNLIVFRTTTGKVHVLDAFCPHLGANIGVGGSVVGEDIRCPFHSWTFNGDGICTSVPGIESLNIPKAKLKRFDCVERNGWVYIWHHDQNAKPTWLPKEHQELKMSGFCGQFTDWNIGTHFLNWYLNPYDEVHLKVLHEMSGIIPNKHVLEKTRFYYIFYKILRLGSRLVEQEDIDWKKSTGIPHLKIVVHLFPVLFGFQLESCKAILYGSYYPPDFFFDVNINFARARFYLFTTSFPIAPTRWRVTFQFYNANPTLLSKFFAKLAQNFLYYSGNAEYVIWQNMKNIERPCFTKMDRRFAQAYRFTLEHYFSRNISVTDANSIEDYPD